ncbi:hypothetical protein F4861DRAFT_290278 [Xylaria intraflava]|nr:hypothetical protein F4861DRAFT_290278 [Xylaria intraflava]
MTKARRELFFSLCLFSVLSPRGHLSHHLPNSSPSSGGQLTPVDLLPDLTRMETSLISLSFTHKPPPMKIPVCTSCRSIRMWRRNATSRCRITVLVSFPNTTRLL